MVDEAKGQRSLWMADGALAGLVSVLLAFVLSRIGFNDGDRLLVAAKTLMSIGLLLLISVHLYSVASLLVGGSYMVDFARNGLVTIGMLAIGILFGALFGLPRAAPEGDPASGAPNGERLSQVADWLTKVILGAALTQLHWLWANGEQINNFFANATGMISFRPLGTILAAAAGICGFLLGYVAALLFLPLALSEATVREATSRGFAQREAARREAEARGMGGGNASGSRTE